jgi:hypothetical protein
MLLGQELAVLHDLAHSTARLSQPHDSTPAQTLCDLCALGAQAGGTGGTAFPEVRLVRVRAVAAAMPAEPADPSQPRFAFLSRGPPARS